MRAALLLVLLGTAAPALAQAPAEPGTTLDISAEGRVSRVPDMATVRAGVVAQAPTAAAALAERSSRMARVLAALRQAGIAPRDIATVQVGIAPQYRYADNQPPVITGYQATNTVSVRFRDIDRAGAILDTLVAAGANQMEGPDLSVDHPEAALDEARTQAVAAARARAELYARAAGLHVRRIVSISEGAGEAGGPPVVPATRAFRVAQAPTQIAAGERDLSVTVQVRFLLD